MNQTASPALLDVRTIAPRERHPIIFSTFRGLNMGDSMEIVNDHDPRPLQHQFQAELPGGFSWEYLEAGPETWRVRITRLVSLPKSSDSCCGGGCGG